MATAPSPDQRTRDCQAALDRKDWAAADAILREQLAQTPDDAGILLKIGEVAYRRGAMAEAERFLNKAALRGAGEPSWLLLGHIFAAGRRSGEALRAYKTVLKANPAHFEALMAVGDLRHRNGDRAGARENYRQAAQLRPKEPYAVVKYSNALWDVDPAAAVKMPLALLEDISAPRGRADLLQCALWQVECWERMKRGQMPYHAARVEELFFTHAAHLLPEFEAAYTTLAADPADLAAKAGLGLARFSRGDRTGAEALFGAAGAAIAGDVLEVARFSPAFHDALRAIPEAELTSALPPVTTVRPPLFAQERPAPGGVLYLSCDHVYFKDFGLPLLCSLHAASPDTPVHLHIFDPPADDIAAITAFCDRLGVRFALTVEAPGLQAAPVREARNYFHAVRFIRFYEHLKIYNCPLWMADVDAVVNRDLGGLFSLLTGADAALRIRPARLEPQNQFNACVVGAAATARSTAYFRQVAAYVAHFYREHSLRWGIDQLALYAVFADLQDRGAAPALALLDTTAVDYDYRSDGFFWCSSGSRKFMQLQRLNNPDTATAPSVEEAPYFAAFEKYWRMAKSLAAALGWKL